MIDVIGAVLAYRKFKFAVCDLLDSIYSFYKKIDLYKRKNPEAFRDNLITVIGAILASPVAGAARRISLNVGYVVVFLYMLSFLAFGCYLARKWHRSQR